MRNLFTQTSRALLAAAAVALPAAALAAGSHSGGHGHSDGMAFGQPAKPAEADRTVEINMGDSYFEPESFSVRPGETIRFIARNQGELLHEFSLGTAAMHAAHQAEMMKMMDEGVMTATGMNHGMMSSAGMDHDDPNSILVEPGETRELVWKFTKPTDLQFACNVPGHYEAGMHGEVEFTKPRKAGS